MRQAACDSRRSTWGGTQCEFVPDGRAIAYSAPGGRLRVRAIDSPELRVDRSLGDGAVIDDLSFTADGLLAVDFHTQASVPESVFVSLATGEAIRPISAIDATMPFFDRRRDLIVGHPAGTCYADARAVVVRSALDPTSVRVLKGHNFAVRDVSISSDGTKVASAAADSSLRLWDIPTGVCTQVIGLDGSANKPRWALNGRSLACEHDDERAILISLDSPESVVLNGHKRFAFHAVFSPDGALIATGGWNDEVRLWDARNGTLISQVVPPDARLQTPTLMGLTPDDSTLYAQGEPKAWSVALLLAHPQEPGRAAAPELAAAIAARPRTSLASQARWASHVGGQTCAISQDREMSAVDRGEGSLRICGGSGETLRTIRADPRLVLAVAFAPGGRLLATAGTDQIIRVWDLQTGAEQHSLSRYIRSIFSLDLSPDGARLASAGDEGTIILWDTKLWEPLAELRGHTQYVSSVSFSPDGTRLVSGSGDVTVRVWYSLTIAERRGRLAGK